MCRIQIDRTTTSQALYHHLLSVQWQRNMRCSSRSSGFNAMPLHAQTSFAESAIGQDECAASTCNCNRFVFKMCLALTREAPRRAGTNKVRFELNLNRKRCNYGGSLFDGEWPSWVCGGTAVTNRNYVSPQNWTKNKLNLELVWPLIVNKWRFYLVDTHTPAVVALWRRLVVR